MSTDRRELLFLVDPTGKSDNEIADEVVKQLRALGIAVTDDEHRADEPSAAD